MTLNYFWEGQLRQTGALVVIVCKQAIASPSTSLVFESGGNGVKAKISQRCLAGEDFSEPTLQTAGDKFQARFVGDWSPVTIEDGFCFRTREVLVEAAAESGGGQIAIADGPSRGGLTLPVSWTNPKSFRASPATLVVRKGSLKPIRIAVTSADGGAHIKHVKRVPEFLKPVTLRDVGKSRITELEFKVIEPLPKKSKAEQITLIVKHGTKEYAEEVSVFFVPDAKPGS